MNDEQIEDSIRRYNQAKADGTLDEKFPVIGKLTSMTNTQLSEWEKEFDERFKDVEFLRGVPVNLPEETRQEIKSFISSLLSLQRRELAEKVEGMKLPSDYPQYNLGYNQALNDVVALLNNPTSYHD